MRATTTWILTAALSLLASCDGPSGPNYTLRLVMLEMEMERVAMEKALLRNGGAPDIVAAGEQMRRWVHDPATARYLGRSDVKGTSADFEQHEAQFLEALERVLAAARAGDEQGARDAFPALEAGCNACHAVFRPDLAQR